MPGGIVGPLTGSSDGCLLEIASDTFEVSGKKGGHLKGWGCCIQFAQKLGEQLG